MTPTIGENRKNTLCHTTQDKTNQVIIHTTQGKINQVIIHTTQDKINQEYNNKHIKLNTKKKGNAMTYLYITHNYKLAPFRMTLPRT